MPDISIRKKKWYDEPAEFLGVSRDIISAAVPDRRVDSSSLSDKSRAARNKIIKSFMSETAFKLYEKILEAPPGSISDIERSESWKEYVLLCVNAEKRSFQRMHYYDMLIRAIIKPTLSQEKNITVLDYGCGSSLFTRMLCEDFGDSIRTISMDVCRYAVDFAGWRNKPLNPNSEVRLIEDVMSVPNVKNVNFILALAVFEHLPNSNEQIRGLIKSLAPGGILVENYSGHSSEEPHKSDTYSAYQNRDINLDMLKSELSLLYGNMPEKVNGRYQRDIGKRYWIKGDCNAPVAKKIKLKLKKNNSVLGKILNRLKLR